MKKELNNILRSVMKGQINSINKALKNKEVKNFLEEYLDHRKDSALLLNRQMLLSHIIQFHNEETTYIEILGEVTKSGANVQLEIPHCLYAVCKIFDWKEWETVKPYQEDVLYNMSDQEFDEMTERYSILNI